MKKYIFIIALGLAFVACKEDSAKDKLNDKKEQIEKKVDEKIDEAEDFIGE